MIDEFGNIIIDGPVHTGKPVYTTRRGTCPNGPGPCMCTGACHGLPLQPHVHVPDDEMWFVDKRTGKVKGKVVNIGPEEPSVLPPGVRSFGLGWMEAMLRRQMANEHGEGEAMRPEDV